MRNATRLSVFLLAITICSLVVSVSVMVVIKAVYAPQLGPAFFLFAAFLLSAAVRDILSALFESSITSLALATLTELKDNRGSDEGLGKN